MRAMILAAGRGVRMGALTADKPKPLLDIGGETLIGRQLRLIAAAGIRDVVINLSWRGDQIRELLGAGDRFGVSIDYSEEGPEPLETAGGIVAALPLLGNAPFLVVNADLATDFDFRRIEIGTGLGTLLLVPNPPHNAKGDYGIDSDSRLTLEPPRFTFSGVSVLSPELFRGLEPGRRPLSQVFEAAIAKQALLGQLHQGLWFDVGTPERLTAARRALSPASA